MKRLKPFVTALACASLLAAGAAAEASADPSTPSWNFFNCTGPTGTPSSFTALHENSQGSGFLLSDGTVTFVALIFSDLTSGMEFSPPGQSSSGIATVTCTVVNPFSGHTLQISGFLTPVG